MTNAEIVEAVACIQCGADRGEPCRSRNRRLCVKRRGAAELRFGWTTPPASPSERNERRARHRARHDRRR